MRPQSRAVLFVTVAAVSVLLLACDAEAGSAIKDVLGPRLPTTTPLPAVAHPRTKPLFSELLTWGLPIGPWPWRSGRSRDTTGAVTAPADVEKCYDEDSAPWTYLDLGSLCGPPDRIDPALFKSSCGSGTSTLACVPYPAGGRAEPLGVCRPVEDLIDYGRECTRGGNWKDWKDFLKPSFNYTSVRDSGALGLKFDDKVCVCMKDKDGVFRITRPSLPGLPCENDHECLPLSAAAPMGKCVRGHCLGIGDYMPSSSDLACLSGNRDDDGNCEALYQACSTDGDCDSGAGPFGPLQCYKGKCLPAPATLKEGEECDHTVEECFLKCKTHRVREGKCAPPWDPADIAALHGQSCELCDEALPSSCRPCVPSLEDGHPIEGSTCDAVSPTLFMRSIGLNFDHIYCVVDNATDDVELYEANIFISKAILSGRRDYDPPALLASTCKVPMCRYLESLLEPVDPRLYYAARRSEFVVAFRETLPHLYRFHTALDCNH